MGQTWKFMGWVENWKTAFFYFMAWHNHEHKSTHIAKIIYRIIEEDMIPCEESYVVEHEAQLKNH